MESSTRHMDPKEPEFKMGQIVKMSVGPRSHVTKPYYVRIKFYNERATFGQVAMITEIPDQHECIMKVGQNWEYHRVRMTIIGPDSVHGHLIINQPLD